MDDITDLLAEAEELADDIGAGAAPEAPPDPPEPFMPVDPPAGRAAGSHAALPAAVRRILKLEVPVIVQLARREMSMQEVLELNVGSVIQFEQTFDTELELVVTNRRIGSGHAVKVGENFGLRVTRIGTIEQTIRALGGV